MSALYDLFENPPSPDGEKQPLHARIVSKGTEGGAFQRLVVAVALQLAAPQSAKVHVVAAVSGSSTF